MQMSATTHTQRVDKKTRKRSSRVSSKLPTPSCANFFAQGSAWLSTDTRDFCFANQCDPIKASLSAALPSLQHSTPPTLVSVEVRIFFVTNNSTKSRKGYKKKFDSLGLVSTIFTVRCLLPRVLSRLSVELFSKRAVCDRIVSQTTGV